MRRLFPLVLLSVATCAYADQQTSKNEQLAAGTPAVTATPATATKAAASPAETATASPAATLAKADQEIIDRAKTELDKIKSLVDAGALPRTRLQMAELALQDAEDEAVLRQSLYGKLSVTDTTREEVQAMIMAAQRLYDRQKIRLDEAEQLVNHGVTARTSVTPLLEDLDSRRKTLDLAQSRARLWDQLATMAKAEALAEATAPRSSAAPGEFDGIKHRYDGKGSFSDTDFKGVETAFEGKFHKGLPISAMGETALHRSLGFDHRGRVDVAVNPDQQEGVWLRGYLEAHQIPYFAFRAAIAGSATGPHIHMGPPSTRLYTAIASAAAKVPKRNTKAAAIVAAKAKTPRRHTPTTVVAD